MKVAVIGAGGVGSAAARFLAAAGHTVTVLEQFEVDHDRGSSYGQSRVIRRVYPDVFYTSLMEHAYRLWRELEAEAGETLLLETGGLFLGPADHPEMRASADALQQAGVPFEVWDARRTAEQVPPIRLAPDEVAISQAESGLLRASRCVRANVRLARAHGAEIRERQSVVGFDAIPSGVRVTLHNGESLTVDRLVVTAGPWTPTLLGELGLPLRVTRQTYVHLAPDDHGSAFAAGQFPVWIDMATYFYGFPIHDEIPGAKIALHQPGELTDPASVRRELDEADRDLLREYARRRLNGLTGTVVYEKICLYTMTPDEDFILDHHPADARIVIVGGLSGHGFKFTVLLGQIAAAMASDADGSAAAPGGYDLSRFRAARFNHARDSQQETEAARR
jgi:sarcosine oxidase